MRRKSKILYFLLIFSILFCSASFSYAETGMVQHGTFYSAFETWLLENRYNERVFGSDPYKVYNVVVLVDFKENQYYYCYEPKERTGTDKEYKIESYPNHPEEVHFFFGAKTYFDKSLAQFKTSTGGAIRDRKPGQLKILGRLFLVDDGTIQAQISDDVENDVGVETIRFDVPTSNSLVKQGSQEIVIALSHLKYKVEFLKFGKTDWGEKVSKSGYSYKFYINDKLVVPSGVRYYKVQSVNTVMSAFYYSEFEDMKEYKLKAELYKDNKLISTNVINVFCQSTFTDLNGDGIDDNTGFKIPNRNPISIFDDFGKFISSLFSSLFSVFSSASIALKSLVEEAGSFFALLASILTVNPKISVIFLTSLSILPILRLAGR